ncbi:unnamed protein product [Spirodela intermedia]|uniref:MADS-box domain-containing protein n=1 Tax=Spirodela intermedia TaxID=51605 RepID=A0A7I8IPJ6_SPIIN|nr:unnamed protein product [Spirodela intermedia]CAA6659887.1 unnamed protein product [Spirodela intermedia]
MVRCKPSLELIADRKRRNATFTKRKAGLKKKAAELATLCDVPTLVLCCGPEGQLEVWPEDRRQALDVIARYRSVATEDRRKRSYDISSFLGDRVMKETATAEQEGKNRELPSPWNFLEQVRGLPLPEMEKRLDGMLKKIEDRMDETSENIGGSLVAGQTSRLLRDLELNTLQDYFIQGGAAATYSAVGFPAAYLCAPIAGNSYLDAGTAIGFPSQASPDTALMAAPWSPGGGWGEHPGAVVHGGETHRRGEIYEDCRRSSSGEASRSAAAISSLSFPPPSPWPSTAADCSSAIAAENHRHSLHPRQFFHFFPVTVTEFLPVFIARTEV